MQIMPELVAHTAKIEHGGDDHNWNRHSPRDTADLKLFSKSKMQGWSKPYRLNGQIPDSTE